MSDIRTDLAIIRADADQIRADIVARLMRANQRGRGHEAAASIDTMIEIMRGDENPHIRLSGELAAIGWASVMTDGMADVALEDDND